MAVESKTITRWTLPGLEEAFNAITHGAGLLAGIIGAPFLFWRTLILRGADVPALTGVGLFAGSMIFLYFSSTVYHTLRSPVWKHRFKIVDHSAIYVFIAGTYSPFLLLHLRDGSGIPVMVIIWSIVFAGVIQKLFFVYKWKILSTILYLVLGWAPILLAKEMGEKIPSSGILYLVLGGVVYSLGTVFYLWKKLPFSHGVWHLFVLAGSALHFTAIFVSLEG